jgi:hypothetical protein
MLGVIAGQPLDTLRIRIQQKGCPDTRVLAVWRAMAQVEGPRGLFKGMSYPLYTTALQVKPWGSGSSQCIFSYPWKICTPAE